MALVEPDPGPGTSSGLATTGTLRRDSGAEALQQRWKRLALISGLGAIACAGIGLGPLLSFRRVNVHLDVWLMTYGTAFVLNLSFFLLLYRRKARSSEPLVRWLESGLFVLNTLVCAALPALESGLGGGEYTAVATILLVRCIFIPSSLPGALFTGLGLWSLYPLTLWAGAGFVPALDTDFQNPARWAQFLSGNIYIGIHLVIGLIAVRFLYGQGLDPLPVQTSGNYRLVSRLGRGGMGEVFLAQHALLERPAAIKMLRPERMNSPAALERFEWEVRTASELTHPNTISIYDFGKTEGGGFYYAMEYLQGMDLQRLADRHGPLAPARTVMVLDQILAALGEAHRRGILHRDVKPSNIFLTERGGDFDFVKVLDFGLAQELHPGADDSSEVSEPVLGTPLYMAPEVFYGDQPVDHRSDLYSLGAVAYFLLSGEPMFESRSTVQILIDQAKTRPASLRDLGIEMSEQLEAVLFKALAKLPTERFENADQFREALHATPEWGHWTREDAARWWSLVAPDVRASADRPITRTPDPDSSSLSLLAA